MERKNDFTKGPLLVPLLNFAVPILMAMFLQALYGAVDLLVVGHYGSTADVSAVATGSQLMQIMTVITTGLAMGVTIAIGQAIGRRDREGATYAVGNGITVFLIYSAVLTTMLLLLTGPALMMLKTPEAAFSGAVDYVRICSFGAVFIVFYNVLASILRGTGDSKTPLIIVTCAAIINIAGDLLLVGVFDMKAAGAAIATVAAQAVSVILCVIIFINKDSSIRLSRKYLTLRRTALEMLKLGAPIALQDGLVAVSFLVINAIVNSLGLVPSAGVGVAEKVCAFIMLVPSSFSQSLSAFVAQNIGAGNTDRAKHSMFVGMGISLAAGVILAYASYFHGAFFAGLFTSDPAVIGAAAAYMKAYAIDTLIVSFLFCYIGYFNGCGKTEFVMIQGIAGAFGVRIPVSYLVSNMAGVTLFHIGLATPASTIIQIIICTVYYLKTRKNSRF